jgi:8-hydroxy-5-deazaflavin:NADPH oxidoreductase
MKEYIKNIGIIGSGGLGSNVARTQANKGIAATISNRRGPASLAPLVAELGGAITAGTVQDAASADIVLIAVRWTDLGTAFSGLPAWNQRIVIDGTNPVEFLDPNSPDDKDPGNPLAAYGIKAIDLGGRSSSEVFQEHVPGARVVKALNHLDVSVLAQPRSVGRPACAVLCRRRHRGQADRAQGAGSDWLLPGGHRLAGSRRPSVGTNRP